MRVVLTDRARLRLAELEDYIAEDDPWIAERVVVRLIERMRGLVDFPKKGRPLADYPASGLRELVEGNYRIVYKLDEVADEAVVLTVFEGRRLLPSEDLGSDADDM